MPLWPKYSTDRGKEYEPGIHPPYLYAHMGGSLEAPENTM